MLNDDQMDKLRAEHGEVFRLEGLEDESLDIVFRCPNRAEYKKFKSFISDDKKKSDADDMLAREIVVFPAKNDLDRLLDRRPGIATKVAGAALQIAMGEATKEAKKL